MSIWFYLYIVYCPLPKREGGVPVELRLAVVNHRFFCASEIWNSISCSGSWIPSAEQLHHLPEQKRRY